MGTVKLGHATMSVSSKNWPEAKIKPLSPVKLFQKCLKTYTVRYMQTEL